MIAVLLPERSTAVGLTPYVPMSTRFSSPGVALSRDLLPAGSTKRTKLWRCGARYRALPLTLVSVFVWSDGGYHLPTPCHLVAIGWPFMSSMYPLALPKRERDTQPHVDKIPGTTHHEVLARSLLFSVRVISSQAKLKPFGGQIRYFQQNIQKKHPPLAAAVCSFVCSNKEPLCPPGVCSTSSTFYFLRVLE